MKIGVLCNESEKQVAREFFELFKTPWDFFVDGRNYDVVLSTHGETTSEVKAKYVIIFSSMPTLFDKQEDILVCEAISDHVVVQEGSRLPIYGRLANLRGKGLPLLYDQSNSDPVVLETFRDHIKILRVGYDLFSEVSFLLTEGQPEKNALIPTLETHIGLVRDWIIDAGIPVVEIPPVPWGYSFIACLTHDVDFIGIRRHRFDHTMWGFIYRAFVGSLLRFLKRNLSLPQMLKNWFAAFSLPLVYLGVHKDFWDQFETYAEIEKDLASTFFLVPFKDYAGERMGGRVSSRRATRYDISDVKPQVKSLVQQDYEIGLHGIDAWQSVERGKKELERIAETTGQNKVGVRMHWLWYDRNSPLILDRAGFDYDSTFGYNETIGFKGGTTQVFQPFGVNHLLELPLHIQDTALFFPGRMSLNTLRAWDLCQQLLDAVEKFGGVFTILWHMRSLAPERLWGDFYVYLLQELCDRGAWFGTASQVVEWFRRRRSVVFDEYSIDGNTIRIGLTHDGCGPDQRMFLRVNWPRKAGSKELPAVQSHLDIPWNGEACIEIPLIG